MSNITLRTFTLIQDIIPMSKALKLSEEEGRTLLKYKDLMTNKYHFLPQDNELKTKKGNKHYVVWKCAILEEGNNLLPAGRTPKKGCGIMNIMETKHSKLEKVSQTSPCRICGKRIRTKGLMYLYSDYAEALKQMEEGI